MNRSERYTIVLEAKQSSVPAIVRLRKLLKIALRVFRFRCVEIKEGGGDYKGGQRGIRASGGAQQAC